MKSLMILLSMVLIMYACGGGSNTASSDTNATSNEPATTETPAASSDGKGVGEIKEVALNDPLNPTMVEKGKAVYDLKCSACHKLTDQRVVGPGWKGVTERRQPVWILNMIMNTEAMLDKDPQAQKLLEECLTRMPNQNLSQEDARNVLEFMYANDGKTVGK